MMKFEEGELYVIENCRLKIEDLLVGLIGKTGLTFNFTNGLKVANQQQSAI
jgi:hypothetical protein